MDHASSLSDDKNMNTVKIKEIKDKFERAQPYSSVDQLALQCGLLAKFAAEPDMKSSSKIVQSRESKLKVKLAQKCLLKEFGRMRSVLSHAYERDSCLGKARQNLVSLQS